MANTPWISLWNDENIELKKDSMSWEISSFRQWVDYLIDQNASLNAEKEFLKDEIKRLKDKNKILKESLYKLANYIIDLKGKIINYVSPNNISNKKLETMMWNIEKYISFTLNKVWAKIIKNDDEF